ncbi:hypothetical protein JCM15457_277 [Liquorilactobacillus sucicola DSM 21376 = JCM 15457]|uniref:Uncharacterized protein n=1 Tax=Liquorilactobacillus sucicola DSM 21376 = JCM 15457 TaxID=1423806 RepID=A0A023CU68_9LACO|nr:hypothetical protein [Liquorilactobacillus sucicola]KRN05343.1 hypothetical protein FD15_GL001895 [Liquorilactobacillus sucicola DSM 21376 = JCM 15457]GAJ25413.1 hypothetical protein JCM15457_277 [Liquorilactobacillus sucicola DSM 21376 = JCM 15457]
MSESYEKKTVTFKPRAKEVVKTAEEESIRESAATLSTTGRLIAYNQELKDSLNNGIRFTQLLDQLVQTDDPKTLFEAAQKLVNYHLDNSYLVFPQQYSRADFYLIFLNRLLELHNSEKVILQSSDRNHELYHEFPGINTHGYFVFQLEKGTTDGAYYTEKNSGEILFYLNFHKNIVRFNSRSLVQLLLVDYSAEIPSEAIKNFENYLLNLGRYLKEDYGFDVDFNLLDPSNSAVYELSNPQIPHSVLDQLFVIAADGGRMLKVGAQNEAILNLNDRTVVTLCDRGNEDNAGVPEWVLKVNDQENEVAWFDILLQYQFIREWYLTNLSDLEIRSDSLYFN